MPPIYYGSAPFALKRGAQALNLYYGSTLISGGGAAWVPAVLLEGSAFSAAQIEPGLAGLKNTTSNANRIYMKTASSFWNGWITGTGATLAMNNDFSNYPGAMLVSVDGGAYAAVANTGTTYTLFSGLSDTEHFVSATPAGAFSTVAYLDKAAGNILNITGATPKAVLSNGWEYAGVAASLSASAGITVASAANFSPAKTKQGASVSSNVGACLIKGPFTRLTVMSAGSATVTAAYVSKNGGAPTKHTISNASAQGVVKVITGLDGSNSTYNVWCDHEGTQNRMFSVAGDSAHVDIGTKKQLHQYGDSITYGIGGLGEVELFRVAASMGFVGLTVGVSGQTTPQLDTAMAGYLSNLTVTSNDVAIVATGRNDGAFDATEEAAYTSLVNKLIAKGYGKIICRGVLPSGNQGGNPVQNATIQSLVTAIGNANTVFMDTSACPAYSTVSNDLTHPAAAGYTTLAGFVEPLYRTILGL